MYLDLIDFLKSLKKFKFLGLLKFAQTAFYCEINIL